MANAAMLEVLEILQWNKMNYAWKYALLAAADRLGTKC